LTGSQDIPGQQMLKAALAAAAPKESLELFGQMF